MRVKAGIFVLLLTPLSAPAQVSFEVGAGVGYTDSRLILFGVTQPTAPLLGMESYLQYNFGAWDGRRETSVIGAAKGLQWRLGNNLVRVSAGASLISNTDARLATNFEFYEQLLLQQRFGSFDVAVSYRHWSNADLKEPNLGMDFIGLQMEQKW